VPAFKGNHAILPIRLTPGEKDQLRTLAADASLSMSDVVRQLVRQETARIERKKKRAG
jgi:hypothetical protein